jgi:spore maturation protein CgeB
MQIGPVSAFGSKGRSAINEKYKQCLYNSKIVLHANPDRWEGDARTWEAISSGALVFVDRMHQPIPHPLVDGEHVIFYDLSAEGLEQLERKIIFYLENDEERARIGQQGRDFVLRYHRSVNRINEMIWHLDAQAADRAELKYLLNQEKDVQSRKLAAKSRPAWQTPGFLEPG